MTDRDLHAPRSVVVAGVGATLLAGGSALAVTYLVTGLRPVVRGGGRLHTPGTGSLPGDWVLFALPAIGLLGFAGLGTVLTAFIER